MINSNLFEIKDLVLENYFLPIIIWLSYDKSN